MTRAPSGLPPSSSRRSGDNDGAEKAPLTFALMLSGIAARTSTNVSTDAARCDASRSMRAQAGAVLSLPNFSSARAPQNEDEGARGFRPHPFKQPLSFPRRVFCARVLASLPRIFRGGGAPRSGESRETHACRDGMGFRSSLLRTLHARTRALLRKVNSAEISQQWSVPT